MPVHVYIKKQNTPEKKAITAFSYASLIIGSLLLFWSFYPILSFEVYSRFFIKKYVKTPVSNEGVPSLNEANSVLGSLNPLSNNLRDYTQASLWFPDRPQATIFSNLNVKEYALSIPKLNIKDAKVVVGGEDLTKSLIHYLPQSLPGEFGNVAIFGHSTLPQLYNTKDYKTIFTYLPSLDNGDNIFVKVGDLEYQYEVFSITTVKPDQVSVLEQNKEASFITLITCVPPGTFWERLVVKAKLKLL
ncbi:MAG: Sortase family protein, LPXTG-site transpeptidase [Candidatus Roizmanbacteria bacterium GW2011_GWA2_35_19]|uniref:Sortase family protein, LPXTG-site transpeptidase n=2 Tax=Candidatus Roizmaniibacteriota TaxID=1752723 RepID=A0A0G0CEC4_9BACT|nr:MAG: Sortase family protein, LPXTG-site transpeptidase [Candidatus Roizmanbacteria bacterium GW2011_GWC2_35_12]KKP74426.1 MAG: Sortase family protein, LPXTG-site transpeptidase [Candidatus Roizmanbacteria bacterium GW2011_GWA2_35_19]